MIHEHEGARARSFELAMEIPEVVVIPVEGGKDIECPYQNVLVIFGDRLKNLSANRTSVALSIVIMNRKFMMTMEPVLFAVKTDLGADLSLPKTACKVRLCAGKGHPLHTRTKFLFLLLLYHATHPFLNIAMEMRSSICRKCCLCQKSDVSPKVYQRKTLPANGTSSTLIYSSNASPGKGGGRSGTGEDWIMEVVVEPYSRKLSSNRSS